MDPWMTALLLKIPIGIVLFVLLFGATRLLAIAVYWLLPNGKLKRELFRVEAGDAIPPPPKLIPRRKADF